MSRDINQLRPEFHKLVNAWLTDCHSVGMDILITCTLRTGPEQDSLFASGRSTPGTIKTNARAGQSAHNYGLAIDFVVMLHGKPEWSGKDPAWAHAISMAESNGMESLAKSAFPELAHLQMPNWKSLINNGVHI